MSGKVKGIFSAYFGISFRVIDAFMLPISAGGRSKRRKDAEEILPTTVCFLNEVKSAMSSKKLNFLFFGMFANNFSHGQVSS